jgi:hypothetical protein
MDKEQFEEAKTRLQEVTRRLKYEEVSPQERERLEKEGRDLMKVIMSPWLPVSWSYRMLMILITAIGLWGFMEGNYLLMLLWLLLPLFSPRIVGKCLRATAGLDEH